MMRAIIIYMWFAPITNIVLHIYIILIYHGYCHKLNYTYDETLRMNIFYLKMLLFTFLINALILPHYSHSEQDQKSNDKIKTFSTNPNP
ncbi:hypothetical protein PFAG_06047 [Plasmodium falciparum Santa Lucia]|uniref:Uncharacterized protein n=1 Tax=Plasmodium falciparum Santa Lucia TaxID=478859 RepID=W7FVU9_PLAFA|nr:hypothetical protein PFAG_06047 [Plasmodium falciparum Santa Lucia]